MRFNKPLLPSPYPLRIGEPWGGGNLFESETFSSRFTARERE